MKVVCFEIEEWESDVLRARLGGAASGAVMAGETLGADNAGLYREAEIVSCFIYSDLSRPVLEKMERLKMIATRSTGTDHIDLGFCRERGITVSNVPSYGEHTVAEHVFALLLALSRHIPQAAARTREGDFSFRGLRGFDLYGKTIGIIGTGAIGLHAARIAQGFGMKVIGHDVNERPDAGFPYAPLPELLRAADVVSLHVPATPQTRHMLSDAEFAMMKDGAVVINTARGAVVDVKALLRALGSGKVGAAGLDVLPEEPAIREEAELLRESFARTHDLETLLADYALLRHRNVIVTPHSAFYTAEAVEKILDTTAGNILSFMAGRPENALTGGGAK